jgi:hypothetical protein
VTLFWLLVFISHDRARISLGQVSTPLVCFLVAGCLVQPTDTIEATNQSNELMLVPDLIHRLVGSAHSCVDLSENGTVTLHLVILIFFSSNLIVVRI